MTDENTPARRSSGNNLSTSSAADDPNFEIVEYDEIYGPPYEVPGVTGLPDDPLTNFIPVPRERDRVDGWTPQRQREFIGTLADTGSVRVAAEMVGMSESGAYQLRRSPGGQAFSYAWELAMRQGTRRLADIAFERAVHGVEDPVFDKDGQCRYVRRKYNDRLLMFLLRAHNPAQYGIGDERIVGLDEQEAVQDWADGYTPLTAALEMIHPTLESDIGDGIVDEDRVAKINDENSKMAE